MCVRSNAWHISGGEGEYENTSCRYVLCDDACLPCLCDCNVRAMLCNLCRRVLVVHSDGSEEVVEIKDDLGVAADDIAEMRRRLTAQGVTDIARLELAS